MPDWKEMYLTMARETEKAVRILTEAQQKCEELYLEDDGPSLRLLPLSDESAPEHDKTPKKQENFPVFFEKPVDNGNFR